MNPQWRKLVIGLFTNNRNFNINQDIQLYQVYNYYYKIQIKLWYNFKIKHI